MLRLPEYDILFWQHCIFLVFFTCGASANQKGEKWKNKNKTEFSIHWLSSTERLFKVEERLILRNRSYNWDLLVFGPEFAMLRTPRPVWDRLGRNSSLKGFPQKDSPPGSGGSGWGRKKRHKEREHNLCSTLNMLISAAKLCILTWGLNEIDLFWGQPQVVSRGTVCSFCCCCCIYV